MKIIRSLILFLAAGILFFSCTKEEPFKQSGYTAGAATRVTLTLKNDKLQSMEQQGKAQTNRALPFAHGVPTTGSMVGSKTFVPKDESLITNVHILVFNPTGEIVSNNYIGKLNFSETSNIVTETYCGENMDVWVVANGDVNDAAETGMNAELQQVKSLNDLQPFLVSAKGDGLSRPDRLTMVGNTTITIAPNMSAIPIQMYYLAAKVTVTVTDNTPADVEITITGWDMINIPKRTYLKERTSEDAVSGTITDDYLATFNTFPFETIHTDTKTWGQSFYLFENRRGKRVDRALPTNPSERYPEMDVSDTDQRGKAWYAPPGATYMLIYGTYSKNDQMNNVVYKIYLGENAYGNYDIIRGKCYTFNVTIIGLNQIDIDTTVDWGNSSFTVTPYGDLEKMDAHPDFRVLRLGTTAADTNIPGYMTVEVLNNDNSTCQWLSLSPLNLYRHGIKQAGNSNQPFDDATGCFVRTKYTPAVADELSFDNATFGMIRKLTKIPFPQLAVFTFQDVVVYADEFNDTGERTAKVRVTYYKDENGTPSVVGQQEFDVAQQDAIKISDDLYIERYEESAMTLQPGMPSNLQGTITAQMQWGYSSEVLYGNTDRYTDGAFLTANAVYKDVTRGNELNAPTWNPVTSYTSYRDLYPRTGEKISSPSNLQTEPIYYYPVLNGTTAFTQYFDPIYNSSAARYCHEKNRDVDGDGVISKDEAVWYLPSLADMIKIANTSRESITPDIYWTSTEESFSQSWVYTFPNTPETKGKAEVLRVRCVRGKGIDSLPKAMLQSTESDDRAKIKLESAAAESGKFTITDDSRLLWTVSSFDDSWLKIATTTTGTGATKSYSRRGGAEYYAYAETANTSTTAERSTTITLTRSGMMDKILTVTQAKTIPPATAMPSSLILNYFSGESQSFTVDDTGSGIAWTVTSNQSWLSIATTSTGTEKENSVTGTGKRTLYAFSTTDNTDTSSSRTANITLSQNNLNVQEISITQKPANPKYPPTYGGWAGCNIYWDHTYDNGKGRLTFDDEGVITNSEYQGILFLWGSLVALSAKYPSEDLILFSPAELPEDGSIPYAQGEFEKLGDENRQYLLEIHNPEKNIGDICKYMTDRGWAPGADKGKKWRLPTISEMESCKPWKPGDLMFERIIENSYGTMRIPKALQGTGVSFPANGTTAPTASPPKVGTGQRYWSGSGKKESFTLPGAINMGSVWNGSDATGYLPPSYPSGVRCVRE